LLATLRETLPDLVVRKHTGGVTIVASDRRVFIPAERLKHVKEAVHVERAHDHLAADVRRALRRTAMTLDRSEVLERVVPVVVPLLRVERVDDTRFTLGLGEDLDLAFVLDSPSTGLWVVAADLERLGLSESLLREASLTNLWRATQGVTIVQEDTEGREVYRFSEGDGLDATRVLLRPLWDEVGHRCGSTLIFCMPSRDRVYAAPRAQPESLGRLSEHLQADWVGRNHSVSPRMWVWRGGRLVPWELNG